MTTEANARYRAGQCIDCGGASSAGRPRCEGCHRKLVEDRNEGRRV